MRTYIVAVLLVLQLTQGFAEEENAADGTVAAQPASVVPPPVGAANGPPQPGPYNASPNDLQNLAGLTSETKHPDGSVTRITHFRGQLPPNAVPQFPQFNPYFAYSQLPPYFYPVVPPQSGFGGPQSFAQPQPQPGGNGGPGNTAPLRPN